MRKSFLKTSAIETNIFTDINMGEVIGYETKAHRFLANNKEQFFLGYATLLSLFYKELSAPEIKVYSFLLAKYNFDSTICIIKSLKVQIGKKTDLSVGTIDNALCGLVKNKLIYTTERSTYKLNARFAFKGSTIERNKVLKAMLELECPNC